MHVSLEGDGERVQSAAAEDVDTRVCARVLLLDPSSRVLLFECRDLADPGDAVRYWFTAGGGREGGESLEEAAAREVCEETGWSGLRLVGPLECREFDFTDHGVPRHQVEHFFAARTDGVVDVKVDGWTELERRAVTSWRWWSTDELEASDVTYFPENLVQLVRRADVALDAELARQDPVATDADSPS